jgi:hypothetical protein
MNHSDLDKLLPGLSRQRTPELPSSFAGNVLREIRLRKAKSTGSHSWFAELLQAWLRPQAAALALSIAVAVGAVAPLTMNFSESSQAAARGLDLSVFSIMAPNAPSGLLAKIR